MFPPPDQDTLGIENGFHGTRCQSRFDLEGNLPSPDKIVLEDEDGIIGTVTSARFVGMETIDRIHLIWDALAKGLTPEERRRVVLIVAATPEEEIAYTS